jgi:hypothetical protein
MRFYIISKYGLLLALVAVVCAGDVTDFQEAAEFPVDGRIPVEPGKGRLLLLMPR